MKYGNVSRGLVWTGIEKVFVQGVSFAQGVVLARLLCPADFGLTAMLGMFLGVGGTLADCGLGSALVVKGFASCGRDVERKVLWWNLGVGGAIYLLLCIAAPWIADFYRQPILCKITWVMGLGIVLNAASSVATARLVREMRFGVQAWANGVSTLVAAAVAVVLALRGAGVWAVATMGVCSAAVRTAIVWTLARGEGGEKDEKGEKGERGERGENGGRGKVAFRDLLGYGWKLTLSGLIHSVYINLYELVLGKTMNPAAVGLYNRGKGWVTAAHNFVNPTVERVAFPMLAKSGGKGMRFLLLNVALMWPGMAALWVWAPEIVGFVFGEQWLASVPCLRILIVGQIFSPFGNIALTALRARGRADLILRTDAIKKPLGLVALACGIPFGIVGICWAKVASDFFESAADVAVALKLLLGWRPPDRVYHHDLDLRSVLWEFRLMTARPRISPRTYPDYWCMYLVALTECGEWKTFDRVYGRYLSRGGRMEKVGLLFALADAAVARGCADPGVVEAARVWQLLYASHAAGALANLVRGKAVALVGNGPQEVGKGLGAEIDAHDIVIRMNNYVIDGYENDYGRRTDVWVKNVTVEMRHELRDPRIKVVMYNADWGRDWIEHGFLPHIARDVDRESVAVDFIDTEERHEIVEAVGGLPTTGGLMVSKLRRCGCKAVDAYGFSFIGKRSGEQVGQYERLPKDVPPDELEKKLAVHEFGRETAYLATVFDGRRMKKRP